MRSAEGVRRRSLVGLYKLPFPQKIANLSHNTVPFNPSKRNGCLNTKESKCHLAFQVMDNHGRSKCRKDKTKKNSFGFAVKQ
jgi:hypothetical protein